MGAPESEPTTPMELVELLEPWPKTLMGRMPPLKLWAITTGLPEPIPLQKALMALPVDELISRPGPPPMLLP